MTRRLLPILAAVPLAATAGSYGPQPFAYPNNTTDLGDGSTISSNTGVASVQSGYLRLTRHRTNNTSSSFKLPVLDPGEEVEAFTATFRLRIFASGQPADGFSLNFGAIPGGDGGGENGFALPGGLFVAFDTYPNGGGDPPSIEAFSNGVSVGNAPRTWADTNGDWLDVAVHWDTAGLDVTFDGSAVFTNLPTPGFTPSAGDRFAFSGRTGGATQHTYIDDLEVQTTTAQPIQTGGPVISEFVADNDDSLEDGELDSPDWLEIYNGQAGAANLAGYTLGLTPTGGTETSWTFPSLSLPGYGYLVVFASSKDRTDPAAALHTNFNLPREGATLVLRDPGGATVSEFVYAAQVEDIAYGELGNDRTRGYLEMPTPGAKNAGLQAAGPPAETPVFSASGGLFTTAFQLSLLPPAAPAATVRYTLDNTVPNSGSPAYTTPFNVTGTTTVRARVFEPGRLPGKIRSRTFIHLGNDVRTFSSDLPIVVADSNGINIDSASNPNNPRPFRPVYTVTIDTAEDDGRAAMGDPHDFTGRGGMHVRGQSSSGFPKKQYAWETWDNFDDDDPASVLGFPSESDWILHAPYSDKTLMRNKIVYDAARELHGNWGGVRTRFVELFFNQGGGSLSMADYRGVYLFSEKIKRDGDRVDVEKLNPSVTDPELITGGYIFKKDKPPYSQPWNTVVEGIPLDTHDPSELNTQQFNYLRSYMNAFEQALHSGQFGDPELGYAAYIDVGSFIDNHLFVELFKEIDGYRISSYFSKPRDGKVRALPVWDYNLSLGNADYLTGWDPEGWYYTEIGGTNYPWYTRLFQDPEFVLAYWDRYWELRRSLFATAEMMARIDGYDDELDEAQARNFDRWDILGRDVWPNPDGWNLRTTHQAEVDWMKDWLTRRLAWTDTQSRGIGGLARPPAFNRYGGNVPDGFALTMSQPNGWGGAKIYYTLDGTDPRDGLGGVPQETVLVGPSAACEWLVPSAANGGSTLTVPQWTSAGAPPNAGSWTAGTQGVGYERTPGGTFDFSSDIGADVEAAMFDVNESVYIRLPFSVADPGALSALTLRMKYDDSFVAYLNGAEVARDDARTAAGTPAWDDGATASHSDSAALGYVDFDLTAHLDKLVPGANTLAVHGLNFFPNSSDALWRCELVGSSGSTVYEYTGALSLSGAAPVRARVHDGASRWSPETAATFVAGAVPAEAGNVVVSELDYRPASPTPAEAAAGFTSRGNFEYVELMNIDDTLSVDLSGVQFSDGVGFTFDPATVPASTLLVPPLGRVVVAANPAAFAMRHPGVTAVGPFTGSLSNDGERVEVLDAAGGTVKAFTYNDVAPWPEAADGDGFSLVLVAPRDNPEHDDAASWRASGYPGGSPGGSDAVTFSGDPDADGDGDGQSAFLEFAQGSSDSDPGGGRAPGASFETLTVGGESGDYVVLEVPFNVGADGLVRQILSSPDLVTWTDTTAAWVLLEVVHHGDGTGTRRYRSAQPAAPGGADTFHRVRVSG